MSKAEERADERYFVTLAEKYAYIDGYEQAEEDLALTVDDIKRIDAILINGWNDSRGNVDYKEVLRRFNLERDKI